MIYVIIFDAGVNHVYVLTPRHFICFWLIQRHKLMQMNQIEPNVIRKVPFFVPAMRNAAVFV